MHSLCNKINLKLKFYTVSHVKNFPMVLSNVPEVLKKHPEVFWKSFPSAVFLSCFYLEGIKEPTCFILIKHYYTIS